MFCKLILVEGMPCTGKSTVSRKIFESLKGRNIPAAYYDEGDNDHPADHEFSAFIKEGEFVNFTDEEQAFIKSNGDKYESGYVISLLLLSSELLDKCIVYKIYDSLVWEDEKIVMLEKWKRFVESARSAERIYVFNSCFLQNYFGEMMMRFDLPLEEINAFIKELYAIISPLNPLLVYLESDSIRLRVGDVAKQRERWLEGVIDFHTTQGYGLNNNYRSFDGYIRCIDERQRRELDIIKEINITYFNVINPYEDYTQSTKDIIDFINTLV